MAKNRPTPKNIPSSPKAVNPTNTPKKINISETNKKKSFKLPESQNKDLLFDKLNYILMGIGGLLLIVGFILMSGGNQDPNVFNEAEIYATRRITIAPITIMLGFILIGIAILKKPKSIPAEI